MKLVSKKQVTMIEDAAYGAAWKDVAKIMAKATSFRTGTVEMGDSATVKDCFFLVPGKNSKAIHGHASKETLK
jgi:hypothetical protein